MSEQVPAMASPGSSAVVDGVDIDAVVAAARSCEAVDDLASGPWGEVVSYLPGRQVIGVRVASGHVVISVRGRWGVPVVELARQLRVAVAALVMPRRVDVVVADLTDPASEAPAGLPSPGKNPAGLPSPGKNGDEVSSWTTSSAGDVPGASTSAPITPTTAATPPYSSPA